MVYLKLYFFKSQRQLKDDMFKEQNAKNRTQNPPFFIEISMKYEITPTSLDYD